MRRLALSAAIGASALAVCPPTAMTASFPAGCAGGSGDTASLIDAIDAANANSGADSVELGAGCRYVVSSVHNTWYGPNGLPPVSSDLTINGNGATIVHAPLTQTAAFRFIFVGADPASPSTPSYV